MNSNSSRSRQNSAGIILASKHVMKMPFVYSTTLLAALTLVACSLSPHNASQDVSTTQAIEVSERNGWKRLCVQTVHKLCSENRCPDSLGAEQSCADWPLLHLQIPSRLVENEVPIQVMFSDWELQAGEYSARLQSKWYNQSPGTQLSLWVLTLLSDLVEGFDVSSLEERSDRHHPRPDWLKSANEADALLMNIIPRNPARVRHVPMSFVGSNMYGLQDIPSEEVKAWRFIRQFITEIHRSTPATPLLPQHHSTLPREQEVSTLEKH